MGKFFDGAGGGLISGAMSLAGGALDALYQRKQQERQMNHDKDMAALNQQNILAQMAQQNEYQVDQWNRENAYNDPSAVASRYREAGINPRAAFGNGSASGAGIAGGLSGAPSGSSTASASNIMGDASFAGLGSAYIAGARLQAQNRKDQADAVKAETEAERVALANARERFLQENGDLFNELNKKGWEADVKQVEAYKASVDRKWYRLEKQNAFDLRTAEIDSMYSSLEKYNAEIEKLKAEKKVSDEQARNLRAENDIIVERLETQKEVTNTQKALTNEVKSRENLNNEQAKKLVAETYQKWVEIGIDGANTILHIVDLIAPFLKQPKQKTKQQVEEIVTYNGKGKVTSRTTKKSDSVAD